MSSRPALTDEQHAALATRTVPVALDAGAGCGKTFVLTERFLSHLQPGADGAPPAELHELIAITFTDPAAREMRSRIRQACRQRLDQATDADAGYWLSLLRSIDSARVNTIHSFCGTLVRTHAVELGVDPLFRVLDAAAAQVLKSEAVDGELRRQIEARDPRAVRLAVEYDLPGLKQRVVGLLDHAGEEGFQKWLDSTPDAMAAAAKAAYRQDYLPRMLSRIAESPHTQRVRELLAACGPFEGAFADTAPRLAEAIDALPDQLPAGGLAELRPLTMVQGVTRAADWPDKQRYADYKAACAKLRSLIDNVRPEPTPEQARQAASLGQDLLAVTLGV
ncbi:MAG: UvrD-helicase domain-containing protein, partial [Planctomycetota bacterium]